MRHALLLALAATVPLASSAPASSQAPGSPVVATAGPVRAGKMEAIGYAPDFQAGCRSSVFSALLVIEVATGSALGLVQGECGVQWTAIPAGSCRSNLPARAGFTCLHKAGGVTRTASTNSSLSLRKFEFSESAREVWFSVSGEGAGVG